MRSITRDYQEIQKRLSQIYFNVYSSTLKLSTFVGHPIHSLRSSFDACVLRWWIIYLAKRFSHIHRVSRDCIDAIHRNFPGTLCSDAALSKGFGYVVRARGSSPTRKFDFRWLQRSAEGWSRFIICPSRRNRVLLWIRKSFVHDNGTILPSPSCRRSSLLCFFFFLFVSCTRAAPHHRRLQYVTETARQLGRNRSETNNNVIGCRIFRTKLSTHDDILY